MAPLPAREPPPEQIVKDYPLLNRWLIDHNNQDTNQDRAVAALQATGQTYNGNGAPAAGLGKAGDLYINNTGGAGTRLYANISGGWFAIA